MSLDLKKVGTIIFFFFFCDGMVWSRARLIYRTSRDYYSRAAFISLRASKMGGYYLRAASIRRNTVRNNKLSVV